MWNGNCNLITKLKPYHRRFDYHSYVFFRYHRLFFGSLIKRGRKLWAFNFFNSVKYKIKSIEGADFFFIFLASMMKITPTVLLVPLKWSGSIHGVPVAISERKQYTFAVKWVIKALRDKNRIVTVSTVSDTLVSAVYGKGISMEKRDAVSRTSRANKFLVRFLR